MVAPNTPLLVAVLAELTRADEGTRRQLAEQLSPYIDAGDPERLLRLEDKARQLGLHPDTLRRMARDGRIWAMKAGREWRFRADCSDIRSAGAFPASVSPTPRKAAAHLSVAAIRGHS